MAVRYAVATGLWSAPATWDGGTLPAPGDSVHANGFTVTIDQDIDVERISNAANAPALANGGFLITSIPAGGRVLACDIYNGSGTSTLTSSAPSGTLTVGTIYGGSSNSAAFSATTGLIDLVATAVVGGTGTNGRGVVASSIASITATLALSGFATNTSAIESSAPSPVITVTTAQVGNNSGHAITTSGASVIVVGEALGGAGTGAGVNTSGPATITAGRAIASGGAGILSSNANAIIDVLGECRASNSNYAVNALTCLNVRVRGPLYHAPNNRVPVYAPFLMVHAGEETVWEVRDESGGVAGGAPVVLSNYVANSPAPENVRAGVAYGPDGTLTGTAVLPDPSAVAAGVPVDDEVGTAALLLTDVAAITGQQIASATGA